MSTSYLEIVELEDGRVVLRRSDDQESCLVTIEFSEESRLYLLENSMEVAKAMIQAGIQTAAELSEQSDADAEADAEALATDSPRILH